MRRKLLLFILAFVLLFSGCTTSARIVEKEEETKIVEEVSKNTDSKSKEQKEETKKETVEEQKPVEKVKKEESKKETKREEPKKEAQPKEIKKEEPKKDVQLKETKKEEVKKEVQSKETKKDIKKNKVEEQPKIKKEELKQSEIKKEPKPVVKKKVEPAIKKSTQPVVKKESNLVVKKETPKQGEKSKAKDVEKPKEVFQPQWSSKSETKYTTEYLNVRSTTSTNSKILKTLPINTKVSVYKVTNKEGWYKLANQKGFVVAQYLTNKKPVVNTTTKTQNQSTNTGLPKMKKFSVYTSGHVFGISNVATQARLDMRYKEFVNWTAPIRGNKTHGDGGSMWLAIHRDTYGYMLGDKYIWFKDMNGVTKRYVLAGYRDFPHYVEKVLKGSYSTLR